MCPCSRVALPRRCHSLTRRPLRRSQAHLPRHPFAFGGAPLCRQAEPPAAWVRVPTCHHRLPPQRLTVTPAAGVTLGPAEAGADATLAWDPSTGKCTLSGKPVVLATEGIAASASDATSLVDTLLPNLAYIVHARKMSVHYTLHVGPGGAVAKLVVRLDPSVLSAETDFAASEAAQLETVNTDRTGTSSAASAVFEHFGADHVVRGMAAAFDPKQLLALCSTKQTAVLPPNTPQHKSLALDLRPYQLRAIRWMVYVTFRLNFLHFDRFELDVRGHT